MCHYPGNSVKYGVDYIEISKSYEIAEAEMKIRVGKYFTRIFKPAYYQVLVMPRKNF